MSTDSDTVLEATKGPYAIGEVPAVEPMTALVPGGAIIAPIGKVKPSPTNPRKTFRDLEGLAESIKAHGILQPLVARTRGKNGSSYFELVFGERRLRAAKIAGLQEVPLLVREMSDLEVLEVQIVENVQRSDVDALEEADGYKVLHEKHGYTVPALAAKIGKSVAYVYARLKLCALGPEGRKALADGLLTTETALYVARVPLALQADAVKELEPNINDHAELRQGEDRKTAALDPVGTREAFARIRNRFMLRLADAPFDVKDPKLVAAAGACGTCPKRTGSQPELFADVKAADTCTDPTCFEKKRDAAWEKRKRDAQAVGQAVVDGKKAKEFFPYEGGHLSHTSGMVDLDARDYSDSKNRTYRQRLGKRLEELTADGAPGPITLVRDEGGKVHELVTAKDMKKLLPKPRVEHEDRPRAKAESVVDKLKRESEKAGNLAALAMVVKKIEAKELNRALWQLLVANEAREAMGDADEVLERRGIFDEDDAHDVRDRKVDVAISRLDVNALRGLYVEMLLARDVDYRTEACALTLFCAELKIDIKQLVAKELARLKTANGKPPPIPATAKAAIKLPTVSVSKKQLAKKRAGKR